MRPTLFIASEAEPRWRSGALWGTHLAWSSDVTYRVDRVTDAVTLIGAGELLRPGEIVLSAGEEYRSPRAAFVWAPDGLDTLAGRVHTWLRARPQHPSSPRPLTLNTWEAVYFDHDPARIAQLAERAAEVGIERFVLDDGWFLARRDDTTSLGDWTVDTGGVARRTRAARAPGARARHGVRTLVRAGDGQRRLRRRPRAPGLAAARPGPPRSRARALVAHAVRHGSGESGGVPACAGSDRRPHRRTRHRLHQVGSQPRPHRDACTTADQAPTRRWRRSTGSSAS